MNLPHQEPILFAKKVLEKDENHVKVMCEFPYPPTLPMLLEAAAQASSAFGMKSQEGFLVAADSVVLHQKVNEKIVIIALTEEINRANMAIFNFDIQDFASGRFTIYVR